MRDSDAQPSSMPSPFFTAEGEDFPSFAARDGSSIYISAAEDWLQSATNVDDQEADDFEFTFFADQDRDAASNVVSIGQVFPVFSSALLDGDSLAGTTEAVHLPIRQLLTEERNTSSRSVPPSRSRWKKSKSTGSLSRRWRLGDLVFGRSHSDRKDKLGFLAEEGNGAKSSPGRETVKGKIFAKSGGGRQSSFLPFKQDIVGCFG